MSTQPFPALVGLLLLTSLACAPEPTLYDGDLGVQAVSVAPGAMAGTFGMKASIVSIAELPIDLGDEGSLTGGETYYRVQRDWLEAEQRYAETTTVCGGRNYDTAGTSSTITEERWRLVPEITTTVITVDHERGSYRAVDHAEQWAVQLDDPVHDEMPADAEEARRAPWTTRIYDVDDDDNPGMTMILEGLGQGEVYFCQRKRLTFDGYIVGEGGETLGLVSGDFDQVTLDATSPLLQNQLERHPHPDPREAWFQTVRLDDGAACDDVLAAVEDERLSRRNPFPR